MFKFFSKRFLSVLLFFEGAPKRKNHLSLLDKTNIINTIDKHRSICQSNDDDEAIDKRFDKRTIRMK
jgi:hypothetical protein